MMKLRTISDKCLTQSVIQLLEKNSVSTVMDFLETEPYTLSIFMEIPIPVIEECKRRIEKLYKPMTCTLAQKSNWLRNEECYGTGIDCLDELLLADPFRGGSVWEVCGECGVGKSLFCHTLMLNYTIKHKCVGLYIDTKMDFSGKLIRLMQRARNLSTRVCGQIMQRIRVVRVLTATVLIDVLQARLGEFEKVSSVMVLPKLIIIDSLPAIFMPYTSKISRPLGKRLLTKVASLIQELSSKYNIAFLLTNLSISVGAEFNNMNDDNDIDSDEEAEENALHVQSVGAGTIATEEQRVQLGLFWSSISRVRFSIDIPSDAEKEMSADADIRKIHILKSCYSATNAHCYVRLTDAGIVSASI